MGASSTIGGVRAAVMCAAVALFSARAQAETRLAAPPECASEAEFLALVHDRMPEGVQVVPEFRAEVKVLPTHAEARIWLEGGPSRRLSGDGCVEVLDGLAIILALRAERLHAERAHSAEAPPTNLPAAGWLPAETSPEPPASAPASALRRETTPVPFVPMQATDESWRFRLGAGAVVLPNIAPGTAFGASFVLAAERKRAGMLRLGLDRSATGEVATPPGSIWVRLTAARLSGCAFALDFGSARVLPCFQIAAGRFEAGGVRSERISSVSQVKRPWISFGGGLRAELRLNRFLVLSGEAEAVMPLVEQDLQFRLPDVTVHQSPSIAPYFGLTAEFVLSGSRRVSAGMAR